MLWKLSVSSCDKVCFWYGDREPVILMIKSLDLRMHAPLWKSPWPLSCIFCCTLCFKLSSVQSLSYVQFFVTPWTEACQASLSITNSWSLRKLMSIESVMPSNHLILCLPLLLLPSIFHSIRVFSNELTLRMRWPKYWSFSFNISPSSEYSGWISFRMYWLDLLAAQGTLKSLLQHHSSKASVLWRSTFFMAQLSHPYMTTGKTIALTWRTFVGLLSPKTCPDISLCLYCFTPPCSQLTTADPSSLSHLWECHLCLPKLLFIHGRIS